MISSNSGFIAWRFYRKVCWDVPSKNKKCITAPDTIKIFWIVWWNGSSTASKRFLKELYESQTTEFSADHLIAQHVCLIAPLTPHPHFARLRILCSLAVHGLAHLLCSLLRGTAEVAGQLPLRESSGNRRVIWVNHYVLIWVAERMKIWVS